MNRFSRRHRAGSALLTSVLMGLGGAAGLAATPHAQAANGHFSCRASVARVQTKAPLPAVTIEPLVANAQDTPCTSTAGTGLNLALPTGAGDHLSVLSAKTTDHEPRRPGDPATASASASVLDAQVGGTLLRASVLTSSANESQSCDQATPTRSGQAHVAAVSINGTNIPVDPAKNTNISLGPLGTLHLNQEVVTPTSLTERALFLETPIADVIIAESKVDDDTSSNNCTPPCPGQNGNDPNAPDPDNHDPNVDPTAERTRGQHPDCAEFSEPMGDGDNTAHDFVHFVRSIDDTETSPDGAFVPVATEDSRNRFNGKAGFFEDGDTSPSIEGDFYDDEDMHFRFAPLSIDAYYAPEDEATSPWRRFCGTGVVMPFADSSDGMDEDDVQPTAPFATGQVRKFLVETFDAKWLDDTRPGGDQSDYWVIDIYSQDSDFNTQQCDPAVGDRDHDDPNPQNEERETLDYHSEGQTIAGNIQIHSARVADDDDDDTTSH